MGMGIKNMGIKNKYFEKNGIHIMWIPSHVGVMGNKRAERMAGEAVQGDTEFAASVRPSDFQPLSRVRMLDGW
jgi:hypothetical protein